MLVRLLLFLLSLCPNAQVTITRQEPLLDADPDYPPEPYDPLDHLDDHGLENWIDFLEYCWSLDPTRHDYPRRRSS